MKSGRIVGGRVRILLAFGIAVVFASLLSGQEPKWPRRGGPDDWTHHHLVFSDAGTAEEAVRHGTLARWVDTVDDPRYVLQREKREAAARSASDARPLLPEIEEPDRVEEPCRRVGGEASKALPRGLARARESVFRFEPRCRPSRPRLRIRRSRQSLHEDWSEDMGSGATVGLGMFPAKYSFDISSASCGNATQPDFVVYNTGLAGSSSQASIVAYDNLYSGCSGTAPSTYWAYDTGGTVVTSVVLSLDGQQVAFAQTNSGGSASLVLLKWKASTSESAGSPGTPTIETAGTYRGCAAACSVTLDFSGGANDSGSSVFYDYSSDTIYVGDDSGKLHKFSGVFAGTPAEAGGTWPVSVSSAALSSPIYDSSSANIFVGNYLLDLTSNCGATGEPCGHFYSVSASSGTVVGTSSQLDYGFGIVDAPLVDGSAGEAYVFAGSDGSFGGVASCGTDVPCSGVFQFATDFTSGNGIEAQVGPGYEFLMSGAFDNEYLSSNNASSPTGHLYVIGNTGPANNTLYQIAIESGVMSTTAVTGPAVSTNYTNGYYSAGLQITEIYTGTNDYIFLSVLSFGAPTNCNASLANGCVIGFDVTSGTVNGSTVPTGATAEAGGTSGIVIDNVSGFGGASNIYYSALADQACPTSGGTGGCAIQISQASP